MAIEFARRLLDWLSRFVNSKIAQLRVRQLPDRDHRRNLGRINRMNTMQLSRSRSPPQSRDERGAPSGRFYCSPVSPAVARIWSCVVPNVPPTAYFICAIRPPNFDNDDDHDG